MPKDLKPYYENLSEQGKKSFKKQLSRRRKSTTVAYLGWLLFGWHYAYLGKWGLQFMYWASAGGLGVWMFLDLFRTPIMVEKHNFAIAYEVMESIKALETNNPPT